MDVSKRRTADARADAARRRLELLGIQLATDAPPEPEPEPPPEPPPPEPEPPVANRPRAGDPADTAGRHRAGARLPPTSGLRDRLPRPLQAVLESAGFTVQHVVVVVVVVVGFACLTAWWAFSSRPADLEPISSPGQSASSTPGPGRSEAPEASADAPPTGDVVIDVSGKVRTPGIVTLPAGSRVADALKKAGGAKSGVDLAALNLARVLVDGEQILVGVEPVQTVPPAGGTPSSGAGPAPSPGGPQAALVNLNTATMEQLDTLPGVGPVTAQSILDWRTEQGRFNTVDELLEVKGIGEVTLADLRDYVTV